MKKYPSLRKRQQEVTCLYMMTLAFNKNFIIIPITSTISLLIISQTIFFRNVLEQVNLLLPGSNSSKNILGYILPRSNSSKNILERPSDQSISHPYLDWIVCEQEYYIYFSFFLSFFVSFHFLSSHYIGLRVIISITFKAITYAAS